jgi:hypothetical protein
MTSLLDGIVERLTPPFGLSESRGLVEFGAKG